MTRSTADARERAARKVAFGDFQTPPVLAAEVARALRGKRLAPRSIVEPMCGIGGLLFAALDAFPGAACGLGVDRDAAHVRAARETAGGRPDAARVTIDRADFFATDWRARLAPLPDPILVIGNPPWVTNAALGALGRDNRPARTNFHGRSGLAAMTGKANFDISEWMLLELLASLGARDATVAMLCKTAVARKVLAFAWERDLAVGRAATYAIDAAAHFDAAVDACLLVCEPGRSSAPECRRFPSLTTRTASATIAYRDGAIVADLARYRRSKPLIGESSRRWRSGIKHDCARVMELRRAGDAFTNGLGETVELEPDLVYPMLKSSDLARGDVRPQRYMLVTQRGLGEDTAAIAESAPKTWAYLARHRASLARRASSIYRGKPAFSIFGVGPYTFAPWKVAISGLYKRLDFRVVGPCGGKPVVLDDTCYFLPCSGEREARVVASLLASDAARELYGAFVFWDAKRPITTELLGRLNLQRLARRLDRAHELA